MEVEAHLERIRQLEEEVLRKKRAIGAMMSPSEKLLAGPRLYDRACQAMEARIRELRPGMTDDEARNSLREALRMVEELERLGCVVEPPDSDWIKEMLKR